MTGPVRDPSAVPSWLARLAARAPSAGGFFDRFPPPATGGRDSAVLMLFGPRPGGGESVVLTERSSTLRSHAGQVSFPGGRLDPEDAGPVEAALRETHEEVGVDPGGVEVVATLPQVHLSVSSSVVTPVVGWWPRPTPLAVRSPREVATVEAVAVDELLDPDHRFVVNHPSGRVGPGFRAGGLFVWGFTAALLAEAFTLSGIDRPWDRDRLVDLPDRPVDPSALRAAPPVATRARRDAR